ncbi:MAG: hypothetical protein QOH21_66 [Acidobacteriota bacterium]|jgi:hypothetical protein|nr:hypothetical protein [Acidobacteriota bacterium]
MAPPLLLSLIMPEPENEEHVERKVVYETVSSSSTRMSGITMAVIAVIAIALVVWVIMQMR